MNRNRRTLAVLALFAVSGPGVVLGVDKIALQEIATGLTAPNLVTHAGDGSGRLFITDQTGQIRIVDAGGTLLPAPFLDLSSKMVTLGAFGNFDERGLLGLAFHPDFVNNRRFFVYYSVPQPAPVPITFETGIPIPGDVTLIGGLVGTQLTPPFYCSGLNAFEIAANAGASIVFDQPVIKVRFFLVHRNAVGVTPGTVTARREDGSIVGVVNSNTATLRCDANNFFEIQDFAFPPAIKRLDLQAGAGVGLVLFLDDLEVTRFNHVARISEFTVPMLTPDVADLASERIILEVDEPQFNHNSGTLAFGPTDGLLYVSLGDGGGGNDVAPFHTPGIGNGQDITNLLGNILRLDVDSGDAFPADPRRDYTIPPGNIFAGTPGCADGCDEIWAYGLRNPFRCSFDTGGTNELFCGDAGQDLYEEVSIVGPGDNMGWNIKEGFHCFDPATPTTPPLACPAVGAMGEPLVDPIIEYPHFEDLVNQTGPIGQVVIGGNIYRGTAFPALAGVMVFGDFSLPPFGGPVDGSIFLGTQGPPGTWTRTQPDIVNGVNGRLGRGVLGFGQDADGEVYLCTNMTGTPFGATGVVFRIVPSPIISVTSLLDHNGTELGIDLTTNLIEPRLNGIQKLELGLNQAVVAASATVSCANSAFGGTVTTTAAGTTVTVAFSQALPDLDCCTVTLSGDAQDHIQVRTLRGDVDRNGSVTTGDASQVRFFFNQTAAAAGPQWDFDSSGTVTTGDFSQIRFFFNNVAPLCP
ncbi:MAG: PQQ-dependent sugar dehydrogenase [Phycisphaerae bacterium]